MNISNPILIGLLTVAGLLTIRHIYRFGFQHLLFGPRNLTMEELGSLVSEQHSWQAMEGTIPEQMRIGNTCNVQLVSNGGVSIFYHKSIHDEGENAETINICPPVGYAGSIVSFRNGDLTTLEKVGGGTFSGAWLTPEQRQQSQDLLASVRAIYTRICTT